MLQPFDDELRDWDEHIAKLSDGALFARIRLRYTRRLLWGRARLRARQNAQGEAVQLAQRADHITELLVR